MFLIRPIQLLAICLFLGLSIPTYASAAPSQADLEDIQLQIELMQKKWEEVGKKHQAKCGNYLPKNYCQCGAEYRPVLLSYFDTGILELLLIDAGIFNAYAVSDLGITSKQDVDAIRQSIQNLRKKCGSWIVAFRQLNGIEKTQQLMDAVTVIKQNMPPKHFQKSTIFWCQTNAKGGYINGQPVFECMGSQQRCNSNSYTSGQCKSKN